MEPEKKNLKVFKEDAKIQHTSHWDWDYLTHAQIDAILKNAQSETDTAEPATGRARASTLGWIGAAMVLIGGGIWIGYWLLS